MIKADLGITKKENQVHDIIFNAEITHYENLLHSFHTYLVFVAQVKESDYMYGNPVKKFTWTIDRSTFAEPIKTINMVVDGTNSCTI